MNAPVTELKVHVVDQLEGAEVLALTIEEIALIAGGTAIVNTI